MGDGPKRKIVPGSCGVPGVEVVVSGAKNNVGPSRENVLLWLKTTSSQWSSKFVGDWVGAALDIAGDSVGEPEGEPVGEPDGALVEEPTEGPLGAAVGDSLGAALAGTGLKTGLDTGLKTGLGPVPTGEAMESVLLISQLVPDQPGSHVQVYAPCLS